MKHFIKKQMFWGLLISVFGCVNSSDFQIPNLINEEDLIKETTDISALIGAFIQSEGQVLNFDPDHSGVVSCYVISSDEAGNFYKTLVVQDRPENPESGLEIKIDLRSYFTKYNVGRKIFLKIGGLSITQVKGKYTLGYLSLGSIVDIPESLIDRHIKRSSETVEIIPKRIQMEEISPSLLNCFVTLEEVQFTKSDLKKSFASEPYDKYYGERLIEQCENKATTALYTSTFANYMSFELPQERFDIRAVLTSDTYKGDIVLILNNLENIQLLDESRCDPEFFHCPDDSFFDGGELIYYEDFEKLTSSRDIEKSGWENVNVNFGNGRFRKRSANENTFLQISAYDSNEYVMEVWLVSPPIDLEFSNNQYLTFDTRATYEEGLLLTAWLSTDYVDNIQEANWHQLEGQVSRGSRDGSNKVFLRFKPVSMDCLDGKVRLGFRYLGSDPGKSTTYDIDNILVLGDKSNFNKRLNDVMSEKIRKH